MEQNAYPPPIIASKSSRKAIWFLVILLIVALAGAGTLAYFWLNERNNNTSLNNQVSSLNQQLTTAQQQDGQTDNPASPQYQAHVGKFTLTLGSEYAIIVNLDGGFEGGPATALSIGKKDANNPTVVTYPHGQQLSVFAYPANTQGSNFTTWVNNKLSSVPESDRQKQPNTKVDGISAEVYKVNGLFTEQRIFFTKNDIFYEIVAQVPDGDTAAIKIRDDVIKGFKFDS